MTQTKIVLSKEVFSRMVEANLINEDTLEAFFVITEFVSQFDDKLLIAIQPRVDWKEILSE